MSSFCSVKGFISNEQLDLCIYRLTCPVKTYACISTASLYWCDELFQRKIKRSVNYKDYPSAGSRSKIQKIIQNEKRKVKMFQRKLTGHRNRFKNTQINIHTYTSKLATYTLINTDSTHMLCQHKTCARFPKGC